MTTDNEAAHEEVNPSLERYLCVFISTRELVIDSKRISIRVNNTKCGKSGRKFVDSQLICLIFVEMSESRLELFQL